MEARKNAPELLQMIQRVRESSEERIPISVEIEKPSEVREAVFKADVDYVFVSKDYAKWKGATGPNDSLETLARMVPDGRKMILICAWGDSGARAACIESGKIVDHCSSPAFSPSGSLVDTTGAGDSFISACLFALQVLKHGLNEAIIFACRFAGAKCGTFGNEGLDNFEQFL